MLSPVNVPHTLISKHYVSLSDISRLDHQLFQRFKSKFVVQPSLSRLLVSFQANKTRPVYRWYKFKEAFSASLVEYLFSHYGIVQGRVPDPFAGSGTTLFVASSLGLDADGIELLPIGQEIIGTKQILDTEFTPEDFERLRYWAEEKVWNMSEVRIALPELRITRGAYSKKRKKLSKGMLAPFSKRIAEFRLFYASLYSAFWSRSVSLERMVNIFVGTIDPVAHKAKRFSIKVSFLGLIRQFVVR